MTSQRREIFQSCLSHMVAAVSASQEHVDPFSQFVVNGLLPQSIFLRLLSQKPALQLYGQPPKYTGSRGEDVRRTFTLTDESLIRLNESDRQLWLGVRDAFGSPQFRSAVLKRLSKGLASRFGIHESETVGLKCYPLPELFRETAGYSIAPHPDSRRKVITMQFCLAEDDSQVDLVTEYYRRSLKPLSFLCEPRGFEIAKRSDFLPNSCTAFTVLNSVFVKSWHGRTSLRADCGIRDSLMCIWYTDPNDANPDVVREQYADEVSVPVTCAA